MDQVPVEEGSTSTNPLPLTPSHTREGEGSFLAYQMALCYTCAMIIEGERPTKKRYLDPECLKHMSRDFALVTPGTDHWKAMVRAASFEASASTNVMLEHATNIRTSLEPGIISVDYVAGFLIALAAIQDFRDIEEVADLDILLDRGFDLFIRNLTTDRVLQQLPTQSRKPRIHIINEVIQDLKDGTYLDVPADTKVLPLLELMRKNADDVTKAWESDFEDRYGYDPMQLAERCIPSSLSLSPEETDQHVASLAIGILDAHELHRTSSNLETKFVVG